MKPCGRPAGTVQVMTPAYDAFNSRDLAAMDAVHHPDMIAHIAGSAEPLAGRAAHGAAMQAFLRVFRDVNVQNDPYPIQLEAATGSPSSAARQARSPAR